jgi:hypothetical protein
MNFAPLFGAIAATAAIQRSSEKQREYEEGFASRRHKSTERFEQLEDEARQSVTNNQQHPITPPFDLRSKWFNDAPKTDLYDYIIEQASQWGADQELEALLELLDDFNTHYLIEPLRAARRPKSPSLKEQALAEIDALESMGVCNSGTIRRALETLPND